MVDIIILFVATCVIFAQVKALKELWRDFKNPWDKAIATVIISVMVCIVLVVAMWLYTL